MAWGGAVTERTTCKQGDDTQPTPMEEAVASFLGANPTPTEELFVKTLFWFILAVGALTLGEIIGYAYAVTAGA